MKGWKLYRTIQAEDGTTLRGGSSFAALDDDGVDVELMSGGIVYRVKKKDLLGATL